MKLVSEKLHILDTTILVPEELYALDTMILIPEELIIYLRVESILHESIEEKLLEYMYETHWMQFNFYKFLNLV